MRRIALILFAIVLHLQSGVAQEINIEKSDSVAKIDDVFYIIHTVQPKQTLFSIAKAYEVKLSRIAFDNPGVLDGLKLGQPLRILKSAIGETRPIDQTRESLQLDGDFVLYTVPKQKTLYAISKEYNTTISSILDANPELADGLKVGSTIRIPTPKIFGDKKADGTPKQEVKMEMVGMPDIVRKQNLPQTSALTERSVGHVTLMLPLYLNQNDTVHAHRAHGTEEIYTQSEMALQFYEGFLLALDTLKQLGYNVEVKVIDTEKRAWRVKELISKGALNNTDLIIGPFYSNVFAEVAHHAYLKCIPLVSPTIKGNGIIGNNPFVFKMIPSDEAMIGQIGRYLSHSDSTNNMILYYGTGEEQKLLSRFRKGTQEGGGKATGFPAYNVTSGADSVRNRLSLTRRNNLIILSNSQVKLAGLIRRISRWTEDARIVTFVPNTWTEFKNLEIDHFDDLRIHMPTAFHIDYSDVEVERFVQKFRTAFKGEPSSFAFRGYDLAFHFIRNLDGIREFGPEYMESVQETGLQSAFGWKRLPDGGFENIGGKMVDYTDLQLKVATD